MCLIIFVWKVIFGMLLILVVNWDEFYVCFVVDVGWWNDYFYIYVGCDL